MSDATVSATSSGQSESAATHGRLAVVIAEEFSAANLPAIFEALNPERYPDVEFFVCSCSESVLREKVPAYDNVRSIHVEEKVRIPMLWKYGIESASADWVALTTAHCIPAQDWLESLLQRKFDSDTVAVGGAIDNRQNDSAMGKAVYALRYNRFTPVKSSGVVDDLAADNAIYRRAAICAHDDLLDEGFWEPAFHRRFVEEGKVLLFDNALLVTHSNCYRPSQFMSQRFEHGVEFGFARMAGQSRIKAMVMLLLSPLIPLVFLRKVLRQPGISRYLSFGLNAESAWLIVFMFSWAVGEGVGYARYLFRPGSSSRQG